MPERIAMKITEEALALIGELTGTPTDVFGDKTYAVFTIIDIEAIEFNVKFMNEDDVFEEVKHDTEMHILSL